MGTALSIVALKILIYGFLFIYIISSTYTYSSSTAITWNNGYCSTILKRTQIMQTIAFAMTSHPLDGALYERVSWQIVPCWICTNHFGYVFHCTSVDLYLRLYKLKPVHIHISVLDNCLGTQCSCGWSPRSAVGEK